MNIEFLNGIGTHIYAQTNPIPKIEKVSKEFQNKVLLCSKGFGKRKTKSIS